MTTLLNALNLALIVSYYDLTFESLHFNLIGRETLIILSKLSFVFLQCNDSFVHLIKKVFIFTPYHLKLDVMSRSLNCQLFLVTSCLTLSHYGFKINRSQGKGGLLSSYTLSTSKKCSLM